MMTSKGVVHFIWGLFVLAGYYVLPLDRNVERGYPTKLALFVNKRFTTSIWCIYQMHNWKSSWLSITCYLPLENAAFCGR